MIPLPRISIIIPSFNQAAFLDSAIRSVVSQNYPDLELIVVDGGSTDGSREIIEKYSTDLTWSISEPDRGQSHAINKGLAHAAGEIVTFIGSDDYYLPGVFQDVAGMVSAHPGAGAISGAFCFLDEGKSQPGEMIPPLIEGGSPRDLTLGPPGSYRLHQAATFYTKSALDATGRYVREDFKYVMDRELLYRICRSFPIALSAKPYSIFRRHAESKSVSDILPFAQEFSRLYELHLSGVQAEDKRRKRMARYRLARGHIKFADAKPGFPGSLLHILRAGMIDPTLLISSAYWGKIRRRGRSARD